LQGLRGRRSPSPRAAGPIAGTTGAADGCQARSGYAEWQRLSPEQREGIRRDMRDYNRDFDRRR